MNFSDRTYPDIVRDLLTVLTGGTIAEVHAIGTTVPELIHLENRPVRRISHLQGQIELSGELVDYRFSEREFELVGTEQNPDDLVAIRFRERAQKPALQTTLTVNYYPDRLRPTPITDVNVGSVARTLIETLSREIATQYQQLQLVYESAFVETATGRSLDKAVALVDTRRLRAGHPVGKVRFSRRSGSPGNVFIPISTVVSDGEGARYLTSQEATLLPNQATVEVWVHGQHARTNPVDSGKLTVLERAIAGIDRVTNDEATYRATEEETDAQLATRARRAIHATGKGTRDAIRFGLEGLPFVSAVTLSEYPDPAVLLPGTLRVDIALSEDNDFNRRLADQRVTELRPAGIYIDRHWAGQVIIGYQVDLILAGSSLTASQVADIKDGITSRLSEYTRNLGPNGTLRLKRLVTLVLQDEAVVDATIAVTADGVPINEETWTLPTGQTATVNSLTPVTFGTAQFDAAVADGPPILIQVDADLSVTSLDIGVESLQATISTILESLLSNLQPGATITFDQIATAIRDDDTFALMRADSVIVFDQEGGGFTELRDNDPAFTMPPGSTLQVRAVRIEEATT
ncbi:hypothetical protein KFU94_44585 [Chloroflexi bacterium TSY]|nr:hypothetical protein [Chloroflexi bacterium TSY]